MKKYIPSLNGLRALSICMVVLTHLDHESFHSAIYNWWPLLADRRLGVMVFFVISGYLITNLLLADEQNGGKVSFKRFYAKRIIRIFPVYYTLLLTYLLLQWAGVFHLSISSWVTSLTFTKYLNWQNDWETTHLWSLSIEEQFYLIWPIVFSYAKRYRNYFAFLIIILVPAFRALDSVYSIKWMNYLSIFQRGDAIMWGCVFALYQNRITIFIRKWIDKSKYYAIIPFLTIILLSLLTTLNDQFHLHLGFIIVPFLTTTGTVAAIAIGAIIIISINCTNNLWFKFLNTRQMNYLGKLSYSIYIWQQMFFSEKLGIFGSFPLNLIMIAIVSNISYHFIEQPFLKLRTKFER